MGSPASWVVVGLDNGTTSNYATVLDAAGRFLVDRLVETPSSARPRLSTRLVVAGRCRPSSHDPAGGGRHPHDVQRQVVVPIPCRDGSQLDRPRQRRTTRASAWRRCTGIGHLTVIDSAAPRLARGRRGVAELYSAWERPAPFRVSRGSSTLAWTGSGWPERRRGRRHPARRSGARGEADVGLGGGGSTRPAPGLGW
jgi:hypothetical protein